MAEAGSASGAPRRDTLRDLRQITIFGDLDDSVMEQIGRMMRRHTYQCGVVFPTEGADASSFYLLVCGHVRVYRSTLDGHEVLLQIAKTGDAFGLLPSDHAYVSSAEGAVLYSVSRSYLAHLMAEHPALGQAAFIYLYDRLVAAYTRMEDLRLGSVTARLVRVLVRLARRSPDSRVLLTHEELAEMIGTRQDEVTKALRHLRAIGVVSFKPHQRSILVHDAMDRTEL